MLAHVRPLEYCCKKIEVAAYESGTFMKKPFVLTFGLVLSFGSMSLPASANTINECDRLAAVPFADHNPPDVHGRELLPPDEIIAAIEACREAAELHPETSRYLYQLGIAYSKASQFELSCATLEKAESSGNAMGRMAKAMVCDMDKTVDAARPSKGFAALKDLAHNDHAFSQNQLSIIYETNSVFSKRDESEVLRWLELSALNDHPPALTQLGLRNWNGDGFQRNRQAGFNFMREAADLHDPRAQGIFAAMLVSPYIDKVDCTLARSYAQQALTNPRANGETKAFAERKFGIVSRVCVEADNVTVEMIQREFRTIGLYHGKIDGDWGDGSIKAAQAFQRQVGETITGKVEDIKKIYPRLKSFDGRIDGTICYKLFLPVGGRIKPGDFFENMSRNAACTSPRPQ